MDLKIIKLSFYTQITYISVSGFSLLSSRLQFSPSFRVSAKEETVFSFSSCRLLHSVLRKPSISFFWSSIFEEEKKNFFFLFLNVLGASLVAQWEKIHLPMQEDTDSIPDPGRFHELWSNWAYRPHLSSLCSRAQRRSCWASMLQQLKPRRPRACTP